MKDLYKILETTSDASCEEIKKTYYKCAMKYHPDRNNSKEAHEKFKDITAAYKILSSPKKKEKYDIEYNYFNSRNKNIYYYPSSKTRENTYSKYSDYRSKNKQTWSTGNYSHTYTNQSNNTHYKVYVNYRMQKKGDLTRLLSSIFAAFFSCFLIFLWLDSLLTDGIWFTPINILTKGSISFVASYFILKAELICTKKIAQLWSKVIKLTSTEIKIIYILLSIIFFSYLKEIFFYLRPELQQTPFSSTLNIISIGVFSLTYLILKISRGLRSFLENNLKTLIFLTLSVSFLGTILLSPLIIFMQGIIYFASSYHTNDSYWLACLFASSLALALGYILIHLPKRNDFLSYAKELDL